MRRGGARRRSESGCPVLLPSGDRAALRDGSAWGPRRGFARMRSASTPARPSVSRRPSIKTHRAACRFGTSSSVATDPTATASRRCRRRRARSGARARLCGCGGGRGSEGSLPLRSHPPWAVASHARSRASGPVPFPRRRGTKNGSLGFRVGDRGQGVRALRSRGFTANGQGQRLSRERSTRSTSSRSAPKKRSATYRIGDGEWIRARDVRRPARFAATLIGPFRRALDRRRSRPRRPSSPTRAIAPRLRRSSRRARARKAPTPLPRKASFGSGSSS